MQHILNGDSYGLEHKAPVGRTDSPCSEGRPVEQECGSSMHKSVRLHKRVPEVDKRLLEGCTTIWARSQSRPGHGSADKSTIRPWVPFFTDGEEVLQCLSLSSFPKYIELEKKKKLELGGESAGSYIVMSLVYPPRIPLKKKKKRTRSLTSLAS